MTGGTHLDDLYFEWLYGHIGAVRNRNPRRSHWQLARVLFKTEFRYFIPNDDNRAQDGLDLREEFMNQLDRDYYDPEWESLPCSFFEMLLGLAQRAEFLADPGTLDGGVTGWFWEMMKNLGLADYTDHNINQGSKNLEAVDHVLAIVNDRTYKPSGEGGLFPLIKPRGDQRKEELWYQLNRYLLDHGFVDPLPDYLDL